MDILNCLNNKEKICEQCGYDDKIILIKQKIIAEAHRLIDTYQIAPRYYRNMDYFKDYVTGLSTKNYGDGEFLQYNGKYIYEGWERGHAVFGFHGDSEEFISDFLFYRFFKFPHCSRYKGRILHIDCDVKARREGSDKAYCCVDVFSGYCCYGKESEDAETAVKNYIDQL